MQPLKITLRLNATSCLGFGLLFLLKSEAVATSLGSFPLLWLQVIGGALLFNAVHLLFSSQRPKLPSWEVYYFAAGDLLWLTASLFILSQGEYVTNANGSFWTLAVGIGVGAIGLVQLWTYAEATNSGVPMQDDEEVSLFLPKELSRWQAICVSWLGLKTWVKIWLIALNYSFLAAFAFWPRPISKYILTAYVASAPWLLAFVISQRGLTRLLGAAHFIVWIPLFVYLLLRLSSSYAGPQILMENNPLLFAYAFLHMTMMTICLCFDIYDMAGWFSGRHARMGSSSETENRQA